jgi:glyoxylase-like metal-dependent hydrolase (beta-lactamase superfamily II)
MNLFIQTIVVGEMLTNCYIVASREWGGECVVVDPGAHPAKILQVLKEKNYSPRYIINTHGHIDHTGANASILEATSAKLLIHHEDVPLLQDPNLNLSALFGIDKTSPPPDQFLSDGDEILCGELEFEVLHTPGHTPGGICLFDKGGVLLSGDSLFLSSIGRTDLPKGSYNTLIQSIKERLMILPDETVIYPGHGPSSTIGWERRRNPFLRDDYEN